MTSIAGSRHAMCDDELPYLRITRHAAARIRQRGFREPDISLLVRFGSDMPDGTVMLTARDAQREIEARRQEIKQFERLRGMTAVVAGGSVVTVYKAGKRLPK